MMHVMGTVQMGRVRICVHVTCRSQRWCFPWCDMDDHSPLHNYVKSPCLMGTLTILRFLWPCSIAMSNYQRVTSFDPLAHVHSCNLHIKIGCGHTVHTHSFVCACIFLWSVSFKNCLERKIRYRQHISVHTYIYILYIDQ